MVFKSVRVPNKNKNAGFKTISFLLLKNFLFEIIYPVRQKKNFFFLNRGLLLS